MSDGDAILRTSVSRRMNSRTIHSRNYPINFQSCLYLATQFVASNTDWLKFLDIKVVFSFGDCPLETRNQLQGVVYFFKKWDNLRPNNMLFILDNCLDWIDICLENNCRVMISCDYDFGICAAVLMAYTMRKYGWTRKCAFDYVLTLCPFAEKTIVFHQQLDLYQAMGYKIDETNEQYRLWIEQKLVDPASSRINLQLESEQREIFAANLKRTMSNMSEK